MYAVLDSGHLLGNDFRGILSESQYSIFFLFQIEGTACRFYSGA